jgi:hypothetical protein
MGSGLSSEDWSHPAYLELMGMEYMDRERLSDSLELDTQTILDHVGEYPFIISKLP